MKYLLVFAAFFFLVIWQNRKIVGKSGGTNPDSATTSGRYPVLLPRAPEAAPVSEATPPHPALSHFLPLDVLEYWYRSEACENRHLATIALRARLIHDRRNQRQGFDRLPQATGVHLNLRPGGLDAFGKETPPEVLARFKSLVGCSYPTLLLGRCSHCGSPPPVRSQEQLRDEGIGYCPRCTQRLEAALSSFKSSPWLYISGKLTNVTDSLQQIIFSANEAGSGFIHQWENLDEDARAFAAHTLLNRLGFGNVISHVMDGVNSDNAQLRLESAGLAAELERIFNGYDQWKLPEPGVSNFDFMRKYAADTVLREIALKHESYRQMRVRTEAIRVSVGGRSRRYRKAHCYNCGKALNNRDFNECGACGWIKCTCGACDCVTIRRRRA